jgi:hypothetical protein
MSADMMLVCHEMGEDYAGDSDKCVFVDETSLGRPHTEFGVLITWIAYQVITEETVERVKYWYKYLNHKDYAHIEDIIEWLESHVGHRLDTECW